MSPGMGTIRSPRRISVLICSNRDLGAVNGQLRSQQLVRAEIALRFCPSQIGEDLEEDECIGHRTVYKNEGEVEEMILRHRVCRSPGGTV